ncbi:MAG: MarR family transcriptional regulator, partial [Candidatus Hodarchaeales archaeon]
RHPNLTSNHLKKRLGLKGSRIFYFLNKLKEDQFIEEKEGKAEKRYEHLATRAFNISQWFENELKELQIQRQFEYHPERGHRKAFHKLQLNLAIALLERELRNLEGIPDEKFDEHQKAELTHQIVFFADATILPSLKEKYSAIQEESPLHSQIIESIKDASHYALFGIYSMDAKWNNQKLKKGTERETSK